ncbi:hypothetical protein [uncultured Desulfobacter sp.]|uniref:hypothetical protein n=1 Tax=uncultured Desulfobacter sp. TaxID=240139 RepID=UPI002AA7547E|nr:hypothetical protein [uncultured Desulfobacter sp.]
MIEKENGYKGALPFCDLFARPSTSLTLASLGLMAFFLGSLIAKTCQEVFAFTLRILYNAFCVSQSSAFLNLMV